MGSRKPQKHLSSEEEEENHYINGRPEWHGGASLSVSRITLLRILVHAGLGRYFSDPGFSSTTRRTTFCVMHTEQHGLRVAFALYVALEGNLMGEKRSYTGSGHS